MTEYEIVKRLEYCINNQCDICQEENGSGFPWVDGRCYGFTERVCDAITLLKEQQPRVMTLDEVKASSGKPIYFESHGTYMGKTGFWIIPVFFTQTGLMQYVHSQYAHSQSYRYSELGLHAYGKIWRCWTACPTDEQRKAVKWNDE